MSVILIKYLGALLSFSLKTSAYSPHPPLSSGHSLCHVILKFLHLPDRVYFFFSEFSCVTCRDQENETEAVVCHFAT